MWAHGQQESRFTLFWGCTDPEALVSTHVAVSESLQGLWMEGPVQRGTSKDIASTPYSSKGSRASQQPWDQSLHLDSEFKEFN